MPKCTRILFPLNKSQVHCSVKGNYSVSRLITELKRSYREIFIELNFNYSLESFPRKLFTINLIGFWENFRDFFLPEYIIRQTTCIFFLRGGGTLNYSLKMYSKGDSLEYTLFLFFLGAPHWNTF